MSDKLKTANMDFEQLNQKKHLLEKQLIAALKNWDDLIRQENTIKKRISVKKGENNYDAVLKNEKALESVQKAKSTLLRRISTIEFQLGEVVLAIEIITKN